MANILELQDSGTDRINLSLADHSGLWARAHGGYLYHVLKRNPDGSDKPRYVALCGFVPTARWRTDAHRGLPHYGHPHRRCQQLKAAQDKAGIEFAKRDLEQSISTNARLDDLKT